MIQTTYLIGVFICWMVWLFRLREEGNHIGVVCLTAFMSFGWPVIMIYELIKHYRHKQK